VPIHPLWFQTFEVYFEGSFNRLTGLEIISYRKETGHPKIWSVRIGTGLFGTTNCPSGNRGPKAHNEVLLAVGDEGLNKLIQLGFVPCPRCTPEKTPPNFREVVQEKISDIFPLSLEDFCDKKVLTFDARRVKWEEILPLIKEAPGRFYLPAGLSPAEVFQFHKRLYTLGVPPNKMGFLDRASPKGFTEYII